MTRPTLLPDPACLRLKLLDASTTTITAMVTMTSPEAECPLCQRRAPRVHSRYVRQVADLPWMGCRGTAGTACAPLPRRKLYPPLPGTPG